ncbi:MAG: glycosyltransferase family 4 protein [Lachnospiraceae bacterium]|nr:glycosyltransferase family 4 protein [Lachnospiraceae bacterium]
MSKRYCIFSAQYLPHMGGVERYTYYLSKELIKLGNKVTVVTSKVSGLPEHEISEGIEIYRMPSYNLMDGRLPVLKPGRKTRNVGKALKAGKYDFVLINTRFYFLSVYGAAFAKKNKIKSAVVEHGTGHLTFNNRILDMVENVYEHGITAVLKHYCHNYFGVSKACCKWSSHFGIKSKGVLYNSIDVDEMEKLLESPVKDYKKSFHIGEEDIVITFTGRMLIEKGIYELMDAVTSMDVSKNVVLFMAGDGPESQNMMKKAQMLSHKNKRIIPLGRIDYPHIAALLKITDIYCLPSVSEGFPTSVLEAAAAKCFVITTYNSGARELIENGVSGTILKDNNPEGLRRALEDAVRNDEYRQSAALKSYEELKSRFTWYSTAMEIEKSVRRKSKAVKDTA